MSHDYQSWLTEAKALRTATHRLVSKVELATMSETMRATGFVHPLATIAAELGNVSLLLSCAIGRLEVLALATAPTADESALRLPVPLTHPNCRSTVALTADDIAVAGDPRA